MSHLGYEFIIVITMSCSFHTGKALNDCNTKDTKMINPPCPDCGEIFTVLCTCASVNCTADFATGNDTSKAWTYEARLQIYYLDSVTKAYFKCESATVCTGIMSEGILTNRFDFTHGGVSKHTPNFGIQARLNFPLVRSLDRMTFICNYYHYPGVDDVNKTHEYAAAQLDLSKGPICNPTTVAPPPPTTTAAPTTEDPVIQVNSQSTKPWSTHYDKWRKQHYNYTIALDADAEDASLTYSEASTLCISLNSKLATPHGYTSDASEDMFPFDGRDYWIGVKFDHALDTYLYNDGVPMDTSWLSWSPWDTATGNPNPGIAEIAGDVSECTVVNNGRWTSVECTESFRFICEFQICPDGWTYNPHVDRCNKFVNSSMTFEEANHNCSKGGAIVETPRSRDAERVLFDLAGVSNRNLWVGMMNIAEDNTWVWNDGAKVTWTAWEGGPAALVLNCMYAKTTANDTDATWHRKLCNSYGSRYPFVCGKIMCRYPYQSVLSAVSSPFYHKCYRSLITERLNARQAGQFCAEDGHKSNPSRLAAPVNQLEDSILHKQGDGEYLFGHYGRFNYDFKWIGYAFNAVLNKWQWNDNAIGYGVVNKVFYKRLDSIMNDTQTLVSLGHTCTMMRAPGGSARLFWSAKPCHYTYGFVCEREQPYILSTCSSLATELNAKLLDGTYVLVPQGQRMKCYYTHINEKIMTYADADRFCSSLGGYVMMSKTTTEFVKAIYSTTARTDPEQFWLGADSIGHCYNQDSWCAPNASNFMYLDGSNFTLNKLPWYIGHPDNLDNIQGCIDVDRNHHLIKDVPCNETRKVVCQVDHNNLRSHRNWDFLTACSGKHTYGEVLNRWHAAPGDVCYHTPATKSKGYKAYVDKCKGSTTNTDTAQPRSKGQTRSLLLSGPIEATNSYIGLYYVRSYLQTGIKWLDRSLYHRYWHAGVEPPTDWVPPAFWNWPPGRSNLTGNDTKCVVMKGNGLWESVNCNETHFASCQKPSLASLSSWRAWRAAGMPSDSDRPHVQYTFVALMTIISFGLGI